MIALQIAVGVLMDLTIVHTSASGDPRASNLRVVLRLWKLLFSSINRLSVHFSFTNSKRPYLPAQVALGASVYCVEQLAIR